MWNSSELHVDAPRMLAYQRLSRIQSPEGAFSPKDNSIVVLQRRGVVFMACYNAIWEHAGRGGHGGSRRLDRAVIKGSGQSRPFVVHVVGDIAPSGEAVGLLIERSEQGPVNLCVRTEDVKYLVSLLLNLGCEATRRQSSPMSDAPPTEAISAAAGRHQRRPEDDDRPFLLLEVGIASLMFMVCPTCLEQVGEMMLTLSAKSSSALS